MAPARCFRPRPRKRRWRAGPGEGRNPRRRRWRAVPGDGEHGEHSAAAAMESRIRRGWADGAGVGGPRVVVARSHRPSLQRRQVGLANRVNVLLLKPDVSVTSR